MLLEDSSSTIGSCFDPEYLKSGCGASDVEAIDVAQTLSVSRNLSLKLTSMTEEDSVHQSQSELEQLAYTESWNEIERMERQLDQNLVGILQNQANVTQLRINTIQSLLKLRAASRVEKRERSFKTELTHPTILTSDLDLPRKKCVRFLIGSKTGPSSRRAVVPTITYSI
jgi:hypothetical protein